MSERRVLLKGQVIFENGIEAEFYLDSMEVEALEEEINRARRIPGLERLNIANEFAFCALLWMKQEGMRKSPPDSSRTGSNNK